LTNIPATPPTPLAPTTAAITRPPVSSLTTPKITEEDMATAEETVEKHMVVLDTKSPMVFMELATGMARVEAKVRREEDSVIERVGGGELECVMKKMVQEDDRS
jgi:hypothetical protein